MDLEIIKDLMDQLREEMKYGKDDLAHRLGRHDEIEPEVKMIKIEGDMPDEVEGMDEEGDDMMGRMPFAGRETPEEEDEEDSLKRRLMKLRG